MLGLVTSAPIEGGRDEALARVGGDWGWDFRLWKGRDNHSKHDRSGRYAPTAGSFVLPIMNDATLKQVAAAKVTVTKGSHVWISNHI